jgi:inorganic pyrophosphatase
MAAETSMPMALSKGFSRSRRSCRQEWRSRTTSVFCPRRSADGDAIDVLLLMDEPAIPGCAIRSRLIGVIEGEQIEGKKKNRNDRLVAMAEANHMYANITRLKDPPKQSLWELQDFFVNYHKLQGKEYRLLGCRGKNTALALIKKAQRAG